MTVDVIIPTLRREHAFTCFERLKHIPWPINLRVVTGGKTWAEAINIGLQGTQNDVILTDDDVFINEGTFAAFDKHYNDADIFGFTLMLPDGRVQHAGGLYLDGVITHLDYGVPSSEAYHDARYVCHATTSLVYIKRHVLAMLKGMAEDIPGVQFEDVDFSFRALKVGYKIMCLPNSAIHMESASKKFMPKFNEKMGIAFEEIKKRHMTPEFVEELKQYPKFLVNA